MFIFIFIYFFCYFDLNTNLTSLFIMPLTYHNIKYSLQDCTHQLDTSRFYRLYIQPPIHIENPTRCHRVTKFCFIFIWSSACFGRHTAHHPDPKTALAASGFAYLEGCWTCICCNCTSNSLPRMQNQRLLVQF